LNWRSVSGLVPNWRLVRVMFIARLSHWEVRGRWAGRRMVGRLVERLNWRYLVIVRMGRGMVHMLKRLVGRLFVMLTLAMMLRTMSLTHTCTTL